MLSLYGCSSSPAPGGGGFDLGGGGGSGAGNEVPPGYEEMLNFAMGMAALANGVDSGVLNSSSSVEVQGGPVCDYPFSDYVPPLTQFPFQVDGCVDKEDNGDDTTTTTVALTFTFCPEAIEDIINNTPPPPPPALTCPLDTNAECDDTNECTTDTCNTTTDACTNEAVANSETCFDGQPCEFIVCTFTGEFLKDTNTGELIEVSSLTIDCDGNEIVFPDAFCDFAESTFGELATSHDLYITYCEAVPPPPA